MAHALGEEAFTDTDGDGFYSFDAFAQITSSEDFTDNQEAWRDDNESGTYNAPELFIDVDTGSSNIPALNGEHDDRTPPGAEGGELFNGLACPIDEIGFEQYCRSELVSVFDTVELIAGTDDAGDLTAGLYTDEVEGRKLDPKKDDVTEGTYYLRLSDDTGTTINFPPFGTTVSTSASGECEVVSPAFSVGNSSAEKFFQFPVTIRTETNDSDTDDFVEITWAIPYPDGAVNQEQLVFDCTPSPP